MKKPHRRRAKKLVDYVWPRMGWRRLLVYYYHRFGRMKGGAYAVGAGFASGVAISFTPFIGFHILLGALMARLLRSSIMAMVLGTVVAGNPWTLPFIWFGTYRLGALILGHANSHTPAVPVSFTIYDLFQRPGDLLLPPLIGSIPFFVVFWIISFYFVRDAVRGYKKDKYRNNPHRTAIKQ
jgi:uncharacterized protein